MKKFMTDIKTLAALLIASATFVACSSDNDIVSEQPAEPTTPKTCTLTVNASKGDDATTRALSLDGSTLSASWAEGEKVIVYKTGESLFPGVPGMPVNIGTLEATDINGNSCTLTGDLDQSPLEGETLQLVFPGSRGTEDGAASMAQDGTLATIQNYFDRAHAEVTVTSVNGTKVSASNASFVNEKAIVKFVLKNGDDVITPSSVSVTVTHSGYESDDPVTFSEFASTYTANGNCFFYAISGLSGGDFGGDIALTATIGSDTYVYEKSGATFTAGQYYAITVKMKKQAPAAKAVADATAEDLGRIIGADGNIYDNATAATTAGTTAEALICYVGDAGTADASSATYKGLALALTDASTSALWCSLPYYYAEICLGTQYGDYTLALGDLAGIANTNALVGHASHTHAAATIARNYKGSNHPTGTSAWFLPSVGQWNKMVNACKNKLGTNNSYKDLRDGFNGVGGTNLQSTDYWTSTQLSDQKAWCIMFDDEHGGYWFSTYKDKNYYVRSALAF